ncbi:TerC family protein, partial [Salmonella enterica]|uniref:TerC family protein n=1 Tax=Salmonella enterica TaxID=28901 RepID=UPI003F79AED0
PEHSQRTRRIGIGLALIMRLGLLATIGWIDGLTTPVFNLGFHGENFDTSFSWRHLILIAGGLFLLWKATKEIHHAVDVTPS